MGRTWPIHVSTAAMHKPEMEKGKEVRTSSSKTFIKLRAGIAFLIDMP